MSNKKKLTWEEYEKKIAGQRTRGKSNVKKVGKAIASPSCIMVQRMSSEPTGRSKKYEPLETREFVDFSEFEEPTINNIKRACESHYNAPRGSCDVLLSDRGPSCFLTEQIQHKKSYLVRFINPDDGIMRKQPKLMPQMEGSSLGNISEFEKPQERRHTSLISLSQPQVPESAFPKSVSISDMLKARKLVKPPDAREVKLTLETYDVSESFWIKSGTKMFNMEKNKFSEGGFREAYMATSEENEKWVIKVYKEGTLEVIKDSLDMSPEDHTRKQVQMHMVAKEIALKLAKKASSSYGKVFQYHTIYFSKIEGIPVTAEKYVPGNFTKYVNNTGECGTPKNSDEDEIYQKAESLSHFSYHESVNELMLLDLQGCCYQLYDPEIATSTLTDVSDNDSKETCAGNLTTYAIDNFFEQHSCNKFCQLLGLPKKTD